MKKVDLAAGVLVIVGALNWGLVAIAEFDLVAAIFGLDFGETNAATRVVYGLVGLSGLWLAARASSLLLGSSRAQQVTAVRGQGTLRSAPAPFPIETGQPRVRNHDQPGRERGVRRERL